MGRRRRKTARYETQEETIHLDLLRRAEALAILEGLRQLSSTRYVSPYSVALVHGGLGDRDQALGWLEKAYVERSDYMPYLNREPMLDGLRSDPRFAALVRRVGLPN